jgi:type VI secretion system protein ImpA
MIVAEELLKPITDEAPCGEDLSNDGILQELEMMARGKEETQWTAAEPPNWKKLQDHCLQLFGRSKDLRIVMTLAVSSLELDGLAGFRETLLLVKGLLERYWPNLHPQLDPADNYDPLQRMNIVASLAMPVGTFRDPLRILERLRSTPLCNSVRMGRFNLADILRAETGTGAQGDKPGLTRPQIESAFQDSKPEELSETVRLLDDCTTLVQGIDELITTSVGATNAPDLTPLSSELAAMRERVAPYVKTKIAAAGEPVVVTPAHPAPGHPGVGHPEVSDGEIRSREEVVRLLHKICRYYDLTEPSSPVPLVLKRAARLAGMDFMQIIEDLSPDAIAQIRTITGLKEE